MNKATLIARVLLGLIYTVFGLNGFLNFITPPPMQQPAMDLMMAFGKTGYFFPFVKIVEIACGVMLLSGCFVPLALVILAPVVVNIVLIHLFLDPAGLPLGTFSLILLVYVAWQYRANYTGLFAKK